VPLMSVRLFAAVLLAMFYRIDAALADDTIRLDAILATVSDGGLARHFYQLHGGGFAWHDSKDAEGDARTALETLAGAATEGLDPQRYRVYRGGDIAADDVALSTALLTYMRDLEAGRPDLETLDADVALPQSSFDAAQILDQALRQHRLAAMLANLAPPFSEYAALKSELTRDRGGPEASVLIANMERWRWMPRALEPDRITINAADASLQLWLGGRPVLASRVIVGKPATPTPILRAEGASLTINPAWTVPQSIAIKEILPKLKRNHAYLASQDMILLNGPPDDPHGLHINWREIRAGTFPYRIRQVPGPRNPLGRIKLELPNRFDVYLHDTPGKASFTRPVRALSHGCVRVEQILPLASYALNADLSAEEQITQAIGTKETRNLPLHRKLPVYFLYWTAFPDAQGKIQFRPDIYGRDRRLIAAMHATGLRIAGNVSFCSKG
jgi:murein L,D-transpeptidase YcbB/YkuD